MGRTAPPRGGGARSRSGKASPIVRIVLLVLCLLWLIPTIGIIVTSFRTPDAANTSGWWTVISLAAGLQPVHDRQLPRGLERGMGNAFINSFAVVLPATIIPIMIAAFAAYAFTFM